MKSIRKLIFASVLTLVVSFSAIAGDTWTPGCTSPPPPPSSERIAITNQSKVETIGIDKVTELLLLLSHSMLSL